MPFGVYVHIPFCAVRCDYCDFATRTDEAHLVDAYVDACVTDLRHRAAAGDGRSATSVFFGGGTPSLLPATSLGRILAAIERAPGAEVTVECNPDSVDPSKLAAYARAGVTRVSLGVQSLRPHVLAALGRTHHPENVAHAIAWARDAGIDRVSVDLIYGTPSETVDDWQRTLDGALALAPDHVSAYALTVESGTPLGRTVVAGSRPAPDDDDQAEKYAIADDTLANAGLDWYEISNWARPGQECRHNLLYWDQGEYLGVGAAAHGHTGGRRWWNVRSSERYVERVAAGRTPEAGSERLDATVRTEEAFTLALRTRGGATLSPVAERTARALAHEGLLVVTDGRVALTRAGRLLASDLTARLLLAGAARPAPATALALGRLDC